MMLFSVENIVGLVGKVSCHAELMCVCAWGKGTLLRLSPLLASSVPCGVGIISGLSTWPPLLGI